MMKAKILPERFEISRFDKNKTAVVDFIKPVKELSVEHIPLAHKRFITEQSVLSGTISLLFSLSLFFFIG